MRQQSFLVQFTTPAFLGNADQAGQWRTPPFKALLRQWWRVAYAADHQFRVDLAAMRREEGLIFGVAADAAADSRKARLRLRLDRWDIGRQDHWRGLDAARVQHPEVSNRNGQPVPVGAQLYLGYGPLGFAAGQTALKANAAIQAGESARIALALPDQDVAMFTRVLALLGRFGTLGGRSRNGWGSFTLAPTDPAPKQAAESIAALPLRPWQEALTLDWPHAIGTDAGGPLIWRTEMRPDWQQVMRRLAEIKIALRTSFAFTTGRNAPQPEARHWLSYPVTNHSVRGWDQLRLPNSLRFKVQPDPDGGLYGMIFHVPCMPPQAFRPEKRSILDVWRHVHALLDDSTMGLQRISTGAMTHG